MIKPFHLFPLSRTKKKALFFAIALLAPLLVLVVITVHFDIKGHWDGIFLLKGRQSWQYELKDDLYVGDGDRLLWSLDFDDPRYRLSRPLRRHKPGEAYLYYEWDARDGSGFIRNFLPNGTQLLTCFGRYMDDGAYVHGLFVGGGLPSSVSGGDNVFMDETGMAYFDGRRWYHVWCNVNEGIVAAQSGTPLTPSRWRFLGSKVIDESDKSLVIASSHEVSVDGVPFRIDRYVYLNAGDTYFVLSIKITNIGTAPARYFYLYGDEPWVGNYGTSAGNVGWVKDRLVEYETVLDSTRYSYAGIFDYGNDAIGEGHDFTMTANFIEWLGKDKPDTVYFSNASGKINEDPASKIPLASNARFLGLQWGPRVLGPQRSAYYTLAIGMAGHDPKTGFPVKPNIAPENIP